MTGACEQCRLVRLPDIVIWQGLTEFETHIARQIAIKGRGLFNRQVVESERDTGIGQTQCGVGIQGLHNLVLPVYTFAQQTSDDEIIRAVDQMIQSKRDLIEERISFTDKERALFWPIYEEFETELRENAETINHLLLKLRGDTVLTEDEADTFIKQMLAAEEQSIEIQKVYAERFRAAIPATKIVDFVMIMMVLP